MTNTSRIQRPAKPALTMTDCLNSPKLRAMVENVEDLWGSLGHGERNDPVLINLLDAACAEFRTLTGLDIDPRN